MSPLLHCELVSAPRSEARRWLLILHGLMGSGRNWSVIADRLVERRPDWGVALLDLPWHGASARLPGPYTLERAAELVQRFVEESGLNAPVILGHSFGGKAALLLAQSILSPRVVFVVDSTPSADVREGRAMDVIRAIREHPGPFHHRRDAVHALRLTGLDEGLARWVAMNLQRRADGFHWTIDPEVMAKLHDEFRRVDAWESLEARPETRFFFLVAQNGWVVSTSDQERLRSHHPNAEVLTLPGGHWLHVDNPEGVLGVIAENLP